MLQEYVIEDPTRTTMGMMPYRYMNARIAGLPYVVAYAIQAYVAALATAAAVAWVFRKPRYPLLS